MPNVKSKLMVIASGVLTLAAIAAGAASALSSDSPDTNRVGVEASSQTGTVYEVAVKLGGPAASGMWREWVDVRTGAWHIDQEGSIRIWDGRRTYANELLGIGRYVRTGSRRYMGELLALPIGARVVPQYLSGQRRFSVGQTALGRRGRVIAGRNNVLTLDVSSGRRAEVRLLRRLDASHPEVRGLFRLTIDRWTDVDVEKAVGARADAPVVAYWFGPSIGRHRATIATQHQEVRSRTEVERGAPDRSDVRAHVTFYSPPEANEATSAQPGQRSAPPGEVQVVSQAVDSARALYIQRMFDGMNGDLATPAWSRSEIKLANGEAATLFPDLHGTGFYVVTSRSLVFVTRDVPGVSTEEAAQSLRPIR